MKRLRYLAVLMVLSSSASTAYAGDSYSFVIGGHRIHIEARRGCGSLSCISWSDSAGSRRNRDDDTAPPAAPAPAAVPVVTAPPATKTASETVAPPSSAPRAIELASATTQSVTPPPPKEESKIVVLEPPVATQPPVPHPAPAPAKAREESAADTPLGDWQTEGQKGLVRIEQCGKSFCGYVLNASTGAKGETVLSNMKSKSDNKWTGDIFSRASGNSYFAKMTLKAPNTLHVEACAVLRFFCSGNDWTRVLTKSDELLISRQGANEPSS